MNGTKPKNKSVSPLAGHLNFGEGSYLESTSHPLYALVFLMPLVGIYEIGTILVNTDAIAHTQARVAAFTWLMGLAEWIGMNRSLAFAFPGLVVMIILLCWHLSSHYPWRIKLGWLGWMAVESVLLSLPLFALGAVINSSNTFAVIDNGSGGEIGSYWANIVTSVGAGIYEELVFRLILVGLIIVVLEDVLKVKVSIATFIAVFVSAGLFAAHHYLGFQGGQIARLEEFKLGGFIFRAAAGLYFALIFRFRGYGITAGTHGAYNIIYFTITQLF